MGIRDDLRRRMGRLAADDEGVALLVVIAAMAMLFVLATMLITMSVYQIRTAERVELRSKAVQIADAGLNAYLYELRRQQTYYKTNPNMGPVYTDEGYWTVAATPPSGTVPLTIRATGYVPARNETRTIVAKVRFPTFADYTTLSDAGIDWGANRWIDGKVHSNDYITQNYATTYITGRVTAVNNISGYTDSDHMMAGYAKNLGINGKIDFAKVTMDITRLSSMATTNGNFYAPSGAKGYRIIFNGDTYNIDRVDSITSAGTMTVTAVRANVPIPPDSVIYVKDDLWVWGTYSKPVTLGCGDPSKAMDYDVTIPDNLVAADRWGEYKLGIVSVSDIIIPYWYNTSYPASFTVQAALLAQSGYMGAWSSGGAPYATSRPRLNIIGSSSYKVAGYFLSGSTVGFLTRGIWFDKGLEFFPPPEYPVLNMGNMKIVSWTEQ